MKSQKPPLSVPKGRKIGASETSERVARELNVQEFMMNELKRVNYEEDLVQRELVTLFIQTN